VVVGSELEKQYGLASSARVRALLLIFGVAEHSVNGIRLLIVAEDALEELEIRLELFAESSALERREIDIRIA
jgi:hypothetical protein